MGRGLILLGLGAVAAFLAWPFVAASRALEEHGIVLAGRVYQKSETVAIHYSGWEVSREITIEYPLPETGGVSFFAVKADAERFDGFHVKQPVSVRYLLHRDVPKTPLSEFWWQVHALPTVRLAAADGMYTRLTPGMVLAGKAVGALAILFVLWRITRSSLLGWAVAAGVAAGGGGVVVCGVFWA